MERVRLFINGSYLGAGGLAVRENRPMAVRVEPIDSGMPLGTLALTIAGVRQGEGAILPSRPGGVEWRFTPAQATGLLPLVVSGSGFQQRMQVTVDRPS